LTLPETFGFTWFGNGTAAPMFLDDASFELVTDCRGLYDSGTLLLNDLLR